MKILQINVDRGKAATALLDKYKTDHDIDIVMLQEPYTTYRPTNKMKKLNNGRNSKTEIWIKDNIDYTIITELTNDNTTTIRINNKAGITYLTSIYDEPGGNKNKRLEEYDRKQREHTTQIRQHLLCGDINAHSDIWGGNVNDKRGEDLINWTIDNGYILENKKHEQPTFQGPMGSSYVDMTLTKNLRTTNWTVNADETLSAHKYITYEIDIEHTTTKRKRTTYDFINTNWTRYEDQIKLQTDQLDWDRSVDDIADSFDKICSQACRRHIRTKTLREGDETGWWNETLDRQRKQLNRERRELQATTDDDERDARKRQYSEHRREYKKLINERRQRTYDQDITDTLKNATWHKAWNILAGKNIQT
ncbi:uncharacterized protein LOC125504797 [Dendroctonus ponderosae]|uniref:uncharacterized protein LOC125504797 n=1 Tax=Dendroctonus ponderosae TaxID=77166 RepID=UPI002035CCAB|nr:uncharacterized protein LOC125504797 [Dendroctonus ponderosae]